jgi:hypothetical protein
LNVRFYVLTNRPTMREHTAPTVFTKSVVSVKPKMPATNINNSKMTSKTLTLNGKFYTERCVVVSVVN